MSKHASTSTTVSQMTLTELASRATKARGLLVQVAELLPGLVHFSVEERAHSNGKLRTGEADAMKRLLVAAGKHPHLFAALAAKDGGSDPTLFEAQPAIDDLDRIDALAALTSEAQALAQTLSDTQLLFAADAREVAAPVHAIIRANKGLDPALASDAAEGLEFYAAAGRSAARSRAKNRADAQAARDQDVAK
jgi:hypothetical protein